MEGNEAPFAPVNDSRLTKRFPGDITALDDFPLAERLSNLIFFDVSRCSQYIGRRPRFAGTRARHHENVTLTFLANSNDVYINATKLSHNQKHPENLTEPEGGVSFNAF